MLQVSPWVIYIPGLWIAIWLIERYELLVVGYPPERISFH